MAYPARLWGVDPEGRAWKEDVLVENVSAGGLYLRLNHGIQKDALVSIAVRLSTAPAGRSPALRLGARGVVLRIEPQDDGSCGVALEFRRRRVL